MTIEARITNLSNKRKSEFTVPSGTDDGRILGKLPARVWVLITDNGEVNEDGGKMWISTPVTSGVVFESSGISSSKTYVHLAGGQVFLSETYGIPRGGEIKVQGDGYQFEAKHRP